MPFALQEQTRTVLLAKDLGALDYMAYTHTCYKGESPPLRPVPRLSTSREGIRSSWHR